MNGEILSFVEKMEAAILTDLVTTDTSNLYQIALNMMAEDKDAFAHICQAYEVVKHKLLGNIILN